MRILVLGAIARHLPVLVGFGGSRGITMTTSPPRRCPDWILVATALERAQMIDRFGLPTYRVIHVPELARDEPLDAGALTTAFDRFIALGAHRSALSPIGVAVTRWLMPWIAVRLERAFGPDIVERDLATRVKLERAQARALRETSTPRPDGDPIRP